MQRDIMILLNTLNRASRRENVWSCSFIDPLSEIMIGILSFHHFKIFWFSTYYSFIKQMINAKIAFKCFETIWYFKSTTIWKDGTKAKRSPFRSTKTNIRSKCIISTSLNTFTNKYFLLNRDIVRVNGRRKTFTN